MLDKNQYSNQCKMIQSYKRNENLKLSPVKKISKGTCIKYHR